MPSAVSGRAGQPGITVPQLDSGRIGDVSTSVNLFRGDVNLSFELLDLPGRNQLDLRLTVFYGSNVHAFVAADNEAAPTGILGVGWHLPFERIVVDAGYRANALDGRYYLVSGGNTTPLHLAGRQQGTLRFELQTNPFWTIEYVPTAERWTVTKEDGTRFVYGRAPDGGSDDALEWRVSWNNWVGSTTQSLGRRFPRAWNLARIENPFGDELRFEYESTLVPIGHGPTYTQSVRIRRIVDTYGRSSVFEYADKEAFEVALPHVPPPGRPAAYQFEYERRYLDAVQVRDSSARLLERIQLAYAFFDVARDEPPSDRYRKRYLTGITRADPSGRSHPPLSFSYYTDRREVNPGALHAITYPEGAVVRYTYAKVGLGQSGTRASIERPAPTCVPRVWHGPDYVVVSWHSVEQASVVLDVYRWNGLWETWRAPVGGGDLHVGDLVVETAVDYFAVHFKDLRTGLYRLLLYRAHPYRHGEWEEHEVRLGSPFADLVTTFGQDFVAAYSTTGSELVIEQWDPFEKEWRRSELSAGNHPHAALAACRDVCIAAFSIPGALRLQLYHSDATRQWISGDERVLSVDVDWDLTSAAGFWRTGDSFAAATFATAATDHELQWRLVLLQWLENYHLLPYVDHAYHQGADLRNPALVSAAGPSLVGNAQHLFRYDGADWVPQDVLDPAPGIEYRYAYGDDIAFGVERNGSVEHFRSWAYDPYEGTWTPDPIPSARADDPHGLPAAPTVHGEYATAGSEVYFRDASNAWKPIASLDPGLDRRTVRNRAPAYIAYELSGLSTSVVRFFKEGRAHGEPAVLWGERIFPDLDQPGTELAGPTAFVTFSAPSLDEASRLHLYCVTESSIAAVQEVSVVSALRVETGYQAIETRYEYDATSARLDSTGQVAQFVRAWSAIPGAGQSEHIFFNGLNPEVPDVYYPPVSAYCNARDFFSLFNGSLYRRIDRDDEGRRINTTTHFLYAFDRAQARKLDGAYVRLRRQESALHVLVAEEADLWPAVAAHEWSSVARVLERSGLSLAASPAGVVQVSEDLLEVGGLTFQRRGSITRVYTDVNCVSDQSYNELGQPFEALTYLTNSSGEPEVLGKQTRYAWEVYPALRDAHIFTPIAEETNLNRTAGTITGRSATTYKSDWPGGPTLWAQHKSYVWNGDPGTEGFDFAAWSGDAEPPAGWIRYEKVVSIDGHGLVIEATDVDGAPSSNVYDAAGRFVVANFENASLEGEEASYYGFEWYESPRGWTLKPGGARIDEGEAHGGKRRLVLPGKAGPATGLAATFRPRRGGRYILSCWFKFGQGAGWSITSNEAVTFVPFPDDHGEWTFFHTVIDAPSPHGDGAEGIALLVHHAVPGGETLVDDICFLPLAAKMEATILEGLRERPVASLTATGDATFYVYDGGGRVAVQVGNEQRPKSLASSYRWREAHTGPFDPRDPNSLLSVTFRGAGDCQRFAQGEEWRRDWAPSGDWSLEDGRLVHPLGNSAALERIGGPEGGPFALMVQVEPLEEIDKAIGLELPGAFAVRWADGRWTLVGPDGAILDQAPAPQMAARDWILLATRHTVQFLADGRRLLKHVFEAPALGRPVLFTSNRIAVTSLTYGGDPLVEVTFEDNVGSPIQQDRLEDAATVVSATVYDEAGRPAVTTKSARVPGELPGFRPGFVRSMDWASGLVTGEVADAYPRDEGYPYRRMRHDGSPLARMIQAGVPGKEFAITGLDPFQARTSRVAYGTNAPWPHLTDLPAAHYLQDTRTDPDGIAKTTVFDRGGRMVAEYVGVPAEDGSAFALTRKYYDPGGRLIETRLPNFFSDLDARTSFVEKRTYDFLGRLTGVSSPNAAAETRLVYDDANRLRFLRDAEGARERYLLYRSYDSQGRMVEQGWCDVAWNEDELKAHANDRGWLPAPPRWQKRIFYDGDGTDARQIGQVVRTETVSTVDGCPGRVVEAYGYSPQGDLAWRRTSLVDSGQDRSFAVAFQHDNVCNLTGIVYGSDADVPLLEVRYGFDHAGRPATLQVRRAGEPWREYVRYEYGPDGQVEREVLDPSATAPFVRRYEYNPPSWITRISDPVFEETVEYTSGGDAGAGYYSGRVARSTASFAAGSVPPGFVRRYGYQHRYDALGRLAVARNTEDDAWSFGAATPARYDPSGNLRLVSEGPAAHGFVYDSGTDRVVTTERNGTPASTFRYTDNGDVREVAPGISRIAYERATGMTARIEGPAGPCTFLYDANERRRLSRSPEGSRFYILSGQDNPLVELVRDGDGKERSSCLLWGPLGLVAIVEGERRWFLLRDRLGSTRAVLDDRGVVCAYNYLPFGGFLGPVFEESAPPSSYLFTGRELDRSTGLYDFKARLYDAALHRFYAIDAADGLVSAYAYGDGDPVDFVDPSGDGPAAVIGIIVLAVIGAYWGGVKANDLEFNPAEWDWGSWETYVEMGVTAASFAAAGYGAASSVAGLTVRAGASIVAKKIGTTLLLEAADGVGRFVEVPYLSMGLSFLSLGFSLKNAFRLRPPKINMTLPSVNVTVPRVALPSIDIPKPPPLPQLNLPRFSVSLPPINSQALAYARALLKAVPGLPSTGSMPNWAIGEFALERLRGYMGNFKGLGSVVGYVVAKATTGNDVGALIAGGAAFKAIDFASDRMLDWARNNPMQALQVLRKGREYAQTGRTALSYLNPWSYWPK